MDKDSKKYEIGFLAKEEGFKNKLVKLLGDFGAEIADNGSMSRIRLAYPIKKETSAFFGYVHFLSQSDAIKKIGESLKLNPEILRYMIIAAPVVQQSAQFVPGKIRRAVFTERPMAPRTEIKKFKPQPILSNEALEKKLEEILK